MTLADVAFADYAKAHMPAFLRTACAVCADATLAEDLVQDVLVKVYARWATVQQTAAPEAYVRRMIVNEFLSWRRKWARVLPSADPAALMPTTGIPDQATASADRALLLDEIRKLPARQHAVIGLRYFADLDDAEIAAALGCKQSTVRVHAARALAALRVSSVASPDDDRGQA